MVNVKVGELLANSKAERSCSDVSGEREGVDLLKVPIVSW